jgi:hypothetical protein
MDTFLRLVKLLGKPEDIPVMAPLIIKESRYRLMFQQVVQCHS